MAVENDSAHGIARDIAAIVRATDYDREPSAILARVVDAAVRDVPGTDQAGVTVLTHGDLRSEASTNATIRRLDRIQHSLGQGPCVEAARTHRTLRVDDAAADHRWPQFLPHAIEAGVISILSVELFALDSVSAALNLYGGVANAFTEESEQLAIMLAAPAGLAVSAVRKIENLTVALESRDLIGQAKGILMERYKITSQEAFDLLVIASQQGNRKLRQIAEELAATGEIGTSGH